MAKQQIAFAVVQMHAIALAIAEEGTIGTQAFFHPVSVAIGLETMFPHFHKIVPVNIALVIIGTNAGAGRNRAIRQNRRHTDARTALVKAVAHLALISTQKTLATVTGMYLAFLSRTFDKLHQPRKIVMTQLKLRIACRTSHRENGKQSPATHPCIVKRLFEPIQIRIVAAVDARHHIPVHLPLPGQQADSIHGTVVAVGMAAQPVVVIGKTVETDGDGMQASFQQALQTLGRQI